MSIFEIGDLEFKMACFSPFHNVTDHKDKGAAKKRLNLPLP